MLSHVGTAIIWEMLSKSIPQMLLTTIASCASKVSSARQMLSLADPWLEEIS